MSDTCKKMTQNCYILVQTLIINKTVCHQCQAPYFELTESVLTERLVFVLDLVLVLDLDLDLDLVLDAQFY